MNQALFTSWMKTFVAAFLSYIIVSGIPVMEMTLSDGKAAVSAALGATLVVIYGWLDPNDTRYGVGSE